MPILERNLEQERNMLAKTKDLARRLGSQEADLNADLQSGLTREREANVPAEQTRRMEPIGSNQPLRDKDL